jgi:spore coat protein CotF
MGGSSSSSTITHKNDIAVVNHNLFKAINQNLTDISVNAIVENAKSCDTSINQTAIFDVSGSNAKCINFTDIDVTQTGYINLKCVQSSTVKTDIMNQMTASIVSTMKSKMQSDIFNKVEAMAAAAAKTGSMSMPFGGGSDSSSSVNIENHTRIDNSTSVDMTNIIKTAINQTFTTKNIDSCSKSLSQRTEFLARYATTSECINFARISVKQATQVITECIQGTDTVNKIINNVAANFGIAVETDATTAVTNESGVNSTAEATQQGVFSELGEMVGNLMGPCIPCASCFGAFPMGPMLSPISIICSLLLCCLMFILPMFMSGGDDPSSLQFGPPQFGPPQFGPPQFGPPQFGPPQLGPPQFGPPQFGPPQFGPPQFGPPQFGPPQY